MMNPLAPLLAKPWLPDPRPAEALHGGEAPRIDAMKFGLWLFLAVVTVLFLLISSTYFGRMTLGDWTPLREPRLLWLNTGILILASIAMQYASSSAWRGQARATRLALVAGAGLAVAFLIGQVMAWEEIRALGFFAAHNPAYAFFYLITALHGLHLAGGLVVLAVASADAWQDADAEKLGRTARLAAIYWHFLLAVWVVMFGFLLADNNGAIDVIQLCRALAARVISPAAGGE